MLNFTNFFRKNIGDKLVEAIRFFFFTFSIPKSLAYNYLALIPNVAKPQKIFDYRPISFCNVCNKIVKKILVNRLRVVLCKLTSKEESGFVHGQNSLYKILVVQEIGHSLEENKLGSPMVLVKIDIEKAYDTIIWNAILTTLTKMRFPTHQIAWIRGCVTSSIFSLPINGCSSKIFFHYRGVRQGDHLSPYLLISSFGFHKFSPLF